MCWAISGRVAQHSLPTRKAKIMASHTKRSDKEANSTLTTTVEIETIDNTGTSRYLYHGAMNTLADALSVVSAHSAAPVNRWVRKRLEDNGGGHVQIGQVSAAICVLR
jgi:hypothetical protein